MELVSFPYGAKAVHRYSVVFLNSLRKTRSNRGHSNKLFQKDTVFLKYVRKTTTSGRITSSIFDSERQAFDCLSRFFQKDKIREPGFRLSLQIFLERQGQVVVFLCFLGRHVLDTFFLKLFQEDYHKVRKYSGSRHCTWKTKKKEEQEEGKGRRKYEVQEECKLERVMKKTWKETRMRAKRWNDVEERHPRDYSSQRACRPQPNRLLSSIS